MSFERHDIKVRELVTGHDLTIPVFKVRGTGHGPKVHIQANVHGAEVQGNPVIYELLKYFSNNPPLGDITLVPHANPFGEIQKVGEYTQGRFDPITGDNWNRMYHHDVKFVKAFVDEYKNHSFDEIKALFKETLKKNLSKVMGNSRGVSFPKMMAYKLQMLAYDADIVLDLHTGPTSADHLYSAEYAKNSCSYFNIPNVLLIPMEFAGAMDEAMFQPWWELHQELKNQDRDFELDFEAFTVELGSEETISLKKAQSDRDSILSYLTYKGVLNEGSHIPKEMKRYGCYLKDYKAIFSPCGGLVEYQDVLGKQVKDGDVLAKILTFKNVQGVDDLEHAVKTIKATQSGIPILHYASSSVHEGVELFKIFTDPFEL